MPTFGDEDHGGHVNGHDVEHGRVEVEALIVDRYLDTLLAGHDETGLAAGHGGAAAADRDHDIIDPAVSAAAEVLRRSLVRVHPSFQFEERLSARLSAMTTDQGDASRLGALIPFRSVRRGSKLDGFRTNQVAGGMEPAAPQEEAEPEISEDARALTSIVERRYGKYLKPAQLEEVTSEIDRRLQLGRTLRDLKLANGDEPDFVFGA